MHKYLLYRSFERSQNPTLIDYFIIVAFLGRTAKAIAALYVTAFESITTVFYK
ncbi:hypothetical protein [uncultured Nostoc sp.]|uniref:hypothetical protein n=1 Tax=uncultured Nostoc sp. TaxID=340711 RepID=UPI0035CA9B4A